MILSDADEVVKPESAESRNPRAKVKSGFRSEIIFGMMKPTAFIYFKDTFSHTYLQSI